MTKRRTKAGLNTLGQIVAGTQLSLNHLSVLPLAARSAVVDILLIGDGVARWEPRAGRWQFFCF